MFTFKVKFLWIFMPKINIMDENLETFFKDFSNIMKKIFFSDSSLKLETRFTLETTMK